MKLSWFTSILGLFFASKYSGAVEQCGTISEAQLYNGKQVASVNEFPWIARIMYRIFLITKRKLLTAHHCVHANYMPIPESILLGDFDYGNNDSEEDCDLKNKCAPPPQMYTIQDIIRHPRFNERLILNDIAILRLEKDVVFNDYVQPICLPPLAMYTADLLGQYILVTGYLNNYRFLGQNKTTTITSTKKMKTVAHVISNERCTKTISSIYGTNAPLLDSSIICASYFGDYPFFSGSVLMGINFVKSKVSNYFLIGILSYGGHFNEDDDVVQYEGFMKISSNINWIESNINQEYQKERKEKFQNLTVWI